MNSCDFDFSHVQQQSTPAKTRGRVGDDVRKRRGSSLSTPKTSRLTGDEGERFMRIVKQTSQINCHREVFELLQSEDMQCLIPHQVLISAWGDFAGRALQRDVVSAIPGLRTGLLRHCTIDGLLRDLCKRWLANGQQSMLLNSRTDAKLSSSACDCALHKFLRGGWSLMVHGVFDVRGGNVSLYLAFNSSSIVNGHRSEHFRLLADHLIAQIDVAFRRVSALKTPVSVNPEFRFSTPMLSAREEQVLLLVSMGNTNADIAQSLGISTFTVKCHMRRIMQKLDASNRTDAVARYRHSDPDLQQNQVTTTTAYDHVDSGELIGS